MPLKVPVSGAGKPGGDFVLEQTFAESMIESLQQQRTKYVADKNDDLVRKVDEQIAYYSSSDAPRSAGYEYVDIHDGTTLADLQRGELQAPEMPVARPCAAPDCVRMHPHDGEPPYVTPEEARAAGLVQDRETELWRQPRPRGRRPADPDDGA